MEINYPTFGVHHCESPTVIKRLVLFGGAKMPDEGTDVFLSSLSAGPVLVIPWASTSQKESFESISSALKSRKDVPVVRSPMFDIMLHESGKDELLSQVAKAGGIFIGGGDQVRLAKILRIQGISESLIAANDRGVVFGGKSAGVACVSNPMISGIGNAQHLMNSSLELVPGLGLLEGVLTDQHFIKRNRMQRLINGLLSSEHRVGLGVDEDSAVLITNSCIAQAIDGNPATVIIKHSNSDLQIVILQKGQNFNFCTGERTTLQ